MKYLVIVVQFFLSTKLIQSANILAVYTIPGFSHRLVQGKVLERLLQNGHNITALSATFIDINHENFTCALIEATNKHFLPIFQLKEMGKNHPVELAIREFIKDHELITSQLANENIQNLVNNRESNKFDLIIMECYTCPHFFLAEIFDCPIVYSYCGEPRDYFHSLLGNYDGTMDEHFFGRLTNFFSTLFFAQKYRIQDANHFESMASHAFPNFQFPSFEEVFAKRVKLAHTFLTLSTSKIKTYMPNYHLIGSIHINPPKKLDKQFSFTQFLDKSVNGVIVMVFGSHSIDLPEHIFIKFLKVFGQLPYDVLWKTNEEKYRHLDIPKNILIQKWLPLADVLAHPKVKLIISHGGMRSIEEAINREVPMILIPICYDEPQNAKLMWKHKISMDIDVLDFDENYLSDIIHEMIKDEYKANIKIIHRQVDDKISTSIDTAVANIELLLRNGKDFYYPYQNVGIVVRYNIDLNAIIGVFLIIFVILMKKFIIFVVPKLFKSRRSKRKMYTKYIHVKI